MSTDDPEDIAEAAATWIVRLSVDDPVKRALAREGFDAWKQIDPRNARVAAGMERLLGETRVLSESDQGDAVRNVLHEALDDLPSGPRSGAGSGSDTPSA